MIELQKRSLPDWEDLRIFLSLARVRSVAKAARALGIDPTTISRRVGRLSETLGHPLFETVRGSRHLTSYGLVLYRHVEAIENEFLSLLGDTKGSPKGVFGQVRLSIPEGLATWMLTPRMRAFQVKHPNIEIDIITSSGLLNPSKREADLSVMLAKPKSTRLVAERLTNYPLGLYATRAYLKAHGIPEHVQDLFNHVRIGYVADFLYAPELDYWGEVIRGLEGTIRSTSINVQYSMIAESVGIGVLPRFIAERDSRLLPVLADDVRLERTFWIVAHGDVRRLARIEAVIEWLFNCVADIP